MKSYEPQSIIHQVIDLERKIVRAFSSSRQHTRARSLAALKPDDATTSTDHESSDFLVNRQSFAHTQQQQMPDEEDEQDLLSLEDDSEYPTICPDEFIRERLNGGRYFVHFYVRGSPVSKAIDTQMKGLSASFQSSCQYVRIDVTKFLTQFPPTDLFSVDVSGEQPTVVAMKNGQVINKISEFCSSDCEELRQWAATIELLSMSF